jgi:hypothetical protein
LRRSAGAPGGHGQVADKLLGAFTFGPDAQVYKVSTMPCMRTLWSAAVVTVVLAGCGSSGSTPTSQGAPASSAAATPGAVSLIGIWNASQPVTFAISSNFRKNLEPQQCPQGEAGSEVVTAVQLSITEGSTPDQVYVFVHGTAGTISITAKCSNEDVQSTDDALGLVVANVLGDHSGIINGSNLTLTDKTGGPSIGTFTLTGANLVGAFKAANINTSASNEELASSDSISLTH